MSTRETIRIVQRLTRRLRGTVRGIVRRATMGPLDTSKGMQTFQAKTLADDVDESVELFEQQGFTCGPVAGSEGLVLRVGGSRAHSVGVAFCDRTARPTDLAREEPCMYHRSGARIVIREDGSIEITAGPTADVTINGLSVPALASAFTTWVVAPNDGGAALKAELVAAGWATEVGP